MSRLEVAKVEGTGKQITIDLGSGTIVEGSLATGTHNIHLQNGARHVLTVKDGRLVEVA